MSHKIKKIKAKTHKATSKRMRVSSSGKIMHLGQGSGNGHSNSYKNRRQKKSSKGIRSLGSSRQSKLVLRLVGR